MPTHAAVVGASIAGLLAARVLAERFDRVTVLERDEPAGAGQRRGAPQGRHLHGLMERGRAILEELHPGLTAEAAALGAPVTEVLAHSRWYLGGLRAHPTSTGLTTLLASRPLLESLVRARTAALPGVVLRARTAVTGLTSVGGTVTGVELADGSTLAADLVVDATGRASRAPEWLAALGAQAPPEEHVEVDLGYASRTYRHRPEHLDGDFGVVVSTMPGQRGGGAIRLEGDRWHVTLGGMLGDHPPTGHEAFTAWAATLPVPDIHRIIADAEPLDDAVPHRFRGSLRRHYARVAAPAGFLVLGDALCSFNPLYAQGMTVAAQQALALRSCLPATADLPARFYAAADPVVDTAWRMSTNSDLNHPGVRGRRTARVRLTNAYITRAHRAAHADPVVSRAFMRVANLVDPVRALTAPGMVLRVLRGSSPGIGSAPRESAQAITR
ncbi:FAD-dependent monooxygenase [Actinokineospora sp. NBRC 105648]|uniref:FAD-dependent oxidoreductase n=1 Tax=Actinokineospora sp. NBRC 105648 TaxID=3032206 RepID=UPI0024A3378D|nr:FAD-dependent monooxygenase [Actinokineospora sp. NBRC 105648]GLZ36520.1 FAD-binding monooxygenase [Actinokineospora sp. NBRC 105648]